MNDNQLKGIQKILILNLGGIGDVLVSVPALRALRVCYPNAEITLLGVSRVKDIADNLSCFNNVYALRMNYVKLSFFYHLIQNFKTLLRLRRKHFDLAVNMRTLVSKDSANKIKFILDIIRPKLKAGRDTEGWGSFFDIKIPETRRGVKFEMEYDIDAAQALGGRVEDRRIDLNIPAEAFEKINRLLAQQDVAPTDFIVGVGPGGMSSRRWPLENFVKVIDAFCGYVCKFVIIGSKDETFLAERLIKNTRNRKVINLCGRIGIMELAALIKMCRLFISNDTGPMHIAAILKTPLIAIFGPGDIIRYDPRPMSGQAVVLYKKADCAPCDKTVCADLSCLRMVTVGEVVEAARGFMPASGISG